MAAADSASSSSYWPMAAVIAAMTSSRFSIVYRYSGMFPCFLGGLVSRLFCSISSARIIRGRVSRIYRDGDVIHLRCFDTLNAEPLDIEADMVVMATAIRPQPGIERLAQQLSASCDRHGFFTEAHPKLRPVETNTAGVFLAGACQAPRDIPDSVAMASAAAAKILDLYANDELEREPIVATVDAAVCSGCFHCIDVCPFSAVERHEITDREGRVVQVVAQVNPGVCQGCGTCQATCPSKSVELEGYTDRQIYAAINALAM